MLCEVRYQNFLSIKSPQVLQLQAESLCEFHDSLLEWTRLKTDVYKVVPIKMLYGMSGSGKSNLLKGIEVIKDLIIEGRMKENDTYERYIYQGEEAFSLGITFIYDNKIFAYDITCEKDCVIYEKLVVNKTCFFVRKKQALQLYSGLKAIQPKGKRTASFSLVKELFYESDPKELFLMHLFKTSFGLSYSWLMREYMQKHFMFMNHLEIETNEWKYETEIHQILMKSGISIHQEYELSSGIKRYFTLMNQILNNKECGACMIIDEIDVGMDPQWMKLIFSYLHNPKQNTGGVQLLFGTYQPCYLDKAVIRRDEVSFVNKIEATTLERLIQHAQRVNNYMKKYLNGEYGAITRIDLQKAYSDH